MHKTADSLDDLLREVLSDLLGTDRFVEATRGRFTEMTGVLLELTNPLARLSRSETKGKIFSALGELLWYLSGTADRAFISHYVPRYEHEFGRGADVAGAYGPRMFGAGTAAQFENIVSLLSSKPSSRKAVIQLFDSRDLALTVAEAACGAEVSEVPCTCTLQFLIRDGLVNLLTAMRSNDAFTGLPHDVFAFTMLHELVARRLGLALGTYKHFVGSLHLYESDRARAERYIAEGWQRTHAMPEMPAEDPSGAIRRVLDYAAVIRLDGAARLDDARLPSYWLDICRLLKIFEYSRRGGAGSLEELARLRAQLSVRTFDVHIADRIASMSDRAQRSRG